MPVTDPVTDLLSEEGLLKDEQLFRALERKARYGQKGWVVQSVLEHLFELQSVEPSAVADCFARRLGVQTASKLELPKKPERLVPRALAERFAAVPLQAEALTIAVVDPLRPGLTEALKAVQGIQAQVNGDERLLLAHAPLDAIRAAIAKGYYTASHLDPLVGPVSRATQHAAMQRFGPKASGEMFEALKAEFVRLSVILHRVDFVQKDAFCFLRAQDSGEEHVWFAAVQDGQVRVTAQDILQVLLMDVRPPLERWLAIIRLMDALGLRARGWDLRRVLWRPSELDDMKYISGVELDRPRYEGGVLRFFYGSRNHLERVVISPDYRVAKETVYEPYDSYESQGLQEDGNYVPGGRPLLDERGHEARPALFVEGDQKNGRAAYWRRLAQDEYASVASFGRSVLELMALGASPKLIERSLKAASDELQHAALCLTVAEQLDGQKASLGKVPALGPRAGGLEEMGRRTFLEGFVPEAFAAQVAKVAQRRMSDRVEVRALKTIARDEARHRDLAKDIIDWAILEGGTSVKNAVQQAAAETLQAALATRLPAFSSKPGWLLSPRQMVRLRRGVHAACARLFR